MNNKLVNVKTGEVVDLTTASPTEITEALSQLIIKRKELEKIEGLVKKFIKAKNLEYEENTNGVMEASYGIARVRKSYRESFNKKKFEAEATDKEKLIVNHAEKIKDKYKTLTETITIF